MTEEKTWSLDECVKRGDDAHKERIKLQKEIERLREQERKQWEFTNGGKIPISDDPTSLDPDEHLMCEELGMNDFKNEANESDTTVEFVVLIIVTTAILYAITYFN